MTLVRTHNVSAASSVRVNVNTRERLAVAYSFSNFADTVVNLFL